MASLEFEFIDCSTISIQFQPNGLAQVSFTVSASSDTLVNDYSTVVFGGVTFKGYFTEYKPQQIEGTFGYDHQFSMIAIGC